MTYTSLTALSEARASDRTKMLSAVKALATRLGVTATDEAPALRRLSTYLTTPQGLAVHIVFDGSKSTKNNFVLHWHMDLSSLAPAQSFPRINVATFGRGGTVNPHHMHKATHVCRGFGELLAQLEESLTMAMNGTAFLPHESQAA